MNSEESKNQPQLAVPHKVCWCWPCILVREQARQKISPHSQPIEMHCASHADRKFVRLQREMYASEFLHLILKLNDTLHIRPRGVVAI
jgi:hypothetical protein